MTSYSSLFIDTWGWLALGHRRDSNHQQIKLLYAQLQKNKSLIYTSDYVLDELTTLLFKREIFEEAVNFVEGIIKAATIGNVRIERVKLERFSATWELRKKLQDKPRISFTDLTSMIIMKELGIQHIMTEDEHFIQVGMGFIKVPEVRF